jgi:FkbM family methyltransferase
MIVNRLDWYRLENGGVCGVGLSLLNSGSYASTETHFLLDLFAGRRQTHGDGVVVLDVGANIGTSTILWATHMRGWGQVIAVEPQERVFYALAGNIALNNCFNARAVWGACGASLGTIGVPRLDYQMPANSGGLSLKPGVEQKPGQPVDFINAAVIPCLRIDDMGLERVDAIKIDVEGMEAEVLAGARDTIANYCPIVFAEHTICGEQAIRDALPGYRFVAAGMDTLAMPEGDPLWERIVLG